MCGKQLSCYCLSVCLSVADFPERQWRAHWSLPQPLHLKITLTDQYEGTASLEFEQVHTHMYTRKLVMGDLCVGQSFVTFVDDQQVTNFG